MDDVESIWDAGVKDKRRESQHSSSSLGKKRRTSTRKGFRDKVAANRAKARVNHPRVGETLRILASQGRGHVSIATSLDT